MSFKSAEGSKFINDFSFVNFPVAQGLVSFPDGLNANEINVDDLNVINSIAVNSISADEIIVDDLTVGNGITAPVCGISIVNADTVNATSAIFTADINTDNLIFGDATTQTTAFKDLSPSPAGTYTTANITVNSKGQITTASSGSIVDTHYIFTSNSGNNNWTFNLNQASNDGYTGTAIEFGKCYDWYLYTNTGSGANKETGFFSNGGGASVNNHPAPSDFGIEQTDNTGVIVIQHTTNNFICSGVGYFIPTNENQTVLTFWQGFEERITFNQFLYSYYHQITGVPVGNTLTLTDKLVNMSITTPTDAPPFINSNGKNQLNVVADNDTLYETTLTMVIVPRPMPPMV